MKLLKLGLRFWIILTSLITFLVGWVMLAHSPKPVQAATTSSLPALSPLQPLDFGDNEENQQNTPLFLPSSRRGLIPTFKTGGS